ncbi:MAG: hypothetical protein MJ252_03355 [archaeon]|nr:hypothetical protein [archaeon]
MEEELTAKYIWNGKSVIYDPNFNGQQATYDQVVEDNNSSYGYQSQSQLGQSQTQGFATSTIRQNEQPLYSQQGTYIEKEPENYQLIDKSLIDNLSLDYYRRKGFLQTKPDELFKYFLEYRSRQKRYMKVPDTIKPLLPYRDGDIQYSIDYYLNPKDGSTYNFFSSNLFPTGANTKEAKTTTGFRKKKPYQSDLQNSNENPQFTKDTMRRLYKPQKEMEEREENKLNTENFDDFFKTLVNDYKKKNQHYTNDYESLIDHWSSVNEDEQKKRKIQWEDGQKDLQIKMNNFLSDEEMIGRLKKLFKKFKGYDSNMPKALTEFWDQHLKEKEKYEKGLFKYKLNDLYNMLEKNYETEEREKKEMKEEYEKMDEELKREEAMERRLKQIEDKEKTEEFFNDLSKPKDRWRTGRVMLKLNRLFQYDNIIKKMIKQEFIDNKRFKFPEEYRVRDEDEQRKIVFKNALEKGAMTREKIEEREEKIKEQLVNRKNVDRGLDQDNRREQTKINQENSNLIKYIKQMVIKYYKLMEKRLGTHKIESISRFLNAMYQQMLSNHKNATKRLFPKNNYGVLKKTMKYKKMHIYYPNSLKLFFFDLLNRLGKNENGKFKFAKSSNQTFWGPSLSNECKYHTGGCPLYCISNTHNRQEKGQRKENFKEIFQYKTNLNDLEKFNLWKRPDLYEDKKKIFMKLSEAEHCTFEPVTNLKHEDLEVIDENELAEKRVNNMKWVGEMGNNLTTKFPVVYKDGICKQAKIAFAEGRYKRCKETLKKAFDLEAIKAHFEKDYEKKLKAKRAKEKEEEEKNKNNPDYVFEREEKKRRVDVPADDFGKPKNEQICREVYFMMKEMEKFEQKKKNTQKKLKEELEMIEYNKKLNSNKAIDTKEINTDPRMTDANPQFAFIKDKYFSFFKTLMCPLKDQCPYVLSKWPKSNVKANVPFGLNCPYAHQVSELKFEKEINERIKLKKNQLKKMEKEDGEPIIPYNWVPAGPLNLCPGCGKTFEDKPKVNIGAVRTDVKTVQGKGLCGYCRYKQKNSLDYNKFKAAAEKANKKILEDKKFDYRPEDVDQDYMRKFGQLKKAIVLFNFRRFTDSHQIMEELNNEVKDEQKEMDERFITLDKKWRAKLEIKEEIPYDILNYNINQGVLDWFKIQTPLAKLLLYCDKMRKGNKFSIYNRHTFLNMQIKEFYGTICKTMGKFNTDVKHLTKQIQDLDLWITSKQKLKQYEPELYDKINAKYKGELCPTLKKYKTEKTEHPELETCKVKIRKCPYAHNEQELAFKKLGNDKEHAKMCPTLVKKGKCDKEYEVCPYAHYANQINLIKPQQTKDLMIRNMNGVKSQMECSTLPKPWSYAKQGYIEEGPKFDRHILANFTDENSIKQYRRTKSAKKFTEKDLEKQKIYAHEI